MAGSTAPDDRLPAHIPALDGVRGLAICLVLTRHCLCEPLEAAAHPGHWQAYAWYWTKMTWCGVDLFFVLSGFLIAKVLLENRNSPRLFRAFYARRAGRILPLYYLVIAGALLARRLLPHDALWHWLFEGQYRWQNYVTFTQNFGMGATDNAGGDALSVSWSLAVEEQFYLVLPLLIRFLPARLLPWFFAAGVPWAYLLRMHWNDARGYYFAAGHADELLLGCLLAWVCLQPAAFAWLRRQGPGMMLLLAFLAAGLPLINQMPEYFGSGLISWLALFFGTLVLIAATQKNNLIVKFLELRWLGFIGTISYGLYLLHRPVQAAICGFIQGSPPVINSARDLYLPVLVVACSIAAASLSWFALERHCVSLGRKVRW